MSILRPPAVFSILIFLFATGLGIGSGTENEKPKPTPTVVPGSLAEYAARIRLRKVQRKTGEQIHITHENIAQIASHGLLTSVSEKNTSQRKDLLVRPDSPPFESQQIEGPAELAETKEMGTRAYWRSRFLELKDRINSLVSASEELERKILRQMEEFYRMDDPTEREQMIRPQLQNSMRRRNELADELAEAQTKLTEFLENAGPEGALPARILEEMIKDRK